MWGAEFELHPETYLTMSMRQLAETMLGFRVTQVNLVPEQIVMQMTLNQHQGVNVAMRLLLTNTRRYGC